jgi:heavy metal translocating P-type ATPase
MLAPARRSVPCAYCGLPVSGGPAEGSTEALYCCFGCRFAAAVSRSSGASDPGAEGLPAPTVSLLTRLGLSVFFAMNVMVFTMALWTQDLYGEDVHSAHLVSLFRYLCLFFAVPVLLLLGGPLLEEAWHNLCRGILASDLLIVLGVAASFLYSAWSVWQESGHVYFEVGCMVLVLVTAGRWLEAVSKSKASQALDRLSRLLPEQVRILARQQTTPQRSVTLLPAADLAAGDVLVVLPGERIPCDGKVLDHPATVDEQMLTGESEPRTREPGEPVRGGTLNLETELVMQASGGVGEGTLARLIALVREAGLTRSPYQRLADRVASWFIPVVAMLAVLAVAYHAAHQDLATGLQTGLAVLLIACPCALGVATPLAVWTALGHAAEHQVLLRSGETLERLARVRAVCLDKTGTLTLGTPEVIALHTDTTDSKEEEEVLYRARALASATNHVHASAIHHFASARLGNQEPARWDHADNRLAPRTLPGRGVIAQLPSGEPLLLGSTQLAEEYRFTVDRLLAEQIEAARAEGTPLTVIGWGGRVRGVFLLREQLRPEAEGAVTALKKQGLAVRVLTGDHSGRGARLADLLGVPVEEGLLPEEKAQAVVRLRQEHGDVAMVGDGINDAPALAASDVGIALGCGADVSRDCAQVCLLGDDLNRLVWGIGLGERTVRTIRINLLWAFAYNVVGIGLALAGLLNPVLAALAMVLSSLLVVWNSLRLAGSSSSPLPLVGEGLGVKEECPVGEGQPV